MRLPLRSDRDGVALAIVAVMMIALLAILSLAIDLGMAYTARAEAQRVADAAALAGASVFQLSPLPADAEAQAEARARDWAAKNVVRNRLVNPDEDVEVWVLMAEEKVRVRVTRAGLGTWFARFLGIDQLRVRAIAAARVMNSGATDCLKPWAVIDLFSTVNTHLVRPDAGTLFDPNLGHHYEPFIDGATVATGYGALPLSDWGSEFVIKSADPNGDYVPEPGVFLPIRLDPSQNQGEDECQRGGGGSDAGGSTYRNNICSCNMAPLDIGDQLPIEPGNMVGPTEKGVEELISLDPLATWNPNTGEIDGTEFSSTSGPRVVKMVLISPAEIVSSGMQEVTVTNFGQFFIEGMTVQNNVARVTGRFMYYIDGLGSGSTTETSSLLKTLRLVE